jgi:hypothetical protein
MSSQPNPESSQPRLLDRGGRPNEHTAVFANGRGFLTYWVPAGGEVVVLLRLVWAE